jgi:hypothetical protein
VTRILAATQTVLAWQRMRNMTLRGRQPWPPSALLVTVDSQITRPTRIEHVYTNSYIIVLLIRSPSKDKSESSVDAADRPSACNGVSGSNRSIYDKNFSYVDP